ncbi:MAG TPA: regulatory signaling modulator protein AmpE [Spongiibacteraceae bacterium]|nr:regulatory signaling modulator protein AmpE [Spongiibacteraceae bacterium]
MEFLVILLTWALVRTVGVPSGLQRDDWLLAWRLRANAAFANLPAEARLLAVAVLPCVLIGLLEWVLAGRWASLPLFALELLVLIYSLGRGDFQVQLSRYTACWQRGDIEAAYQEAISVVGIDAGQPIGSAADLHTQVRRRLLYLAFERWFAVVFWFYFLGPWAALFYRILQLLNARSAEPDRLLLQRWLAWIEWLPVRLLGLAFALTGNFANCIGAWREHLSAWLSIPDLLASYATHALDGAAANAVEDGADFADRAAHELNELMALLSRSFIAWLLLFALLQMLR